MDKKERLNKLIRYIVYAYDLPFVGTIRQVGEKIGMSSSNLSAALNGNERFLTDSLIKKINTAYGSPFCMEWLLYGTGEMLSKEAAPIGNEDWVVKSQQETIAKLTESLEALSKLIKKEV